MPGEGAAIPGGGGSGFHDTVCQYSAIERASGEKELIWMLLVFLILLKTSRKPFSISAGGGAFKIEEPGI